MATNIDRNPLSLLYSSICNDAKAYFTVA